MNPIGVFMFQVSGLNAGQNYNFFLQLTSAYGKKGPITRIEQATYTDVVRKFYFITEIAWYHHQEKLRNSLSSSREIT